MLPHVLLAENNQQMLEALAGELSARGWMVSLAPNADRLIQMLSRSVIDRHFAEEDDDRIDLVFCDVPIQNASWLDIFSALREADWDVPVVLVDSTEDGALYLSKPLRHTAVLSETPDVPRALEAVLSAAHCWVPDEGLTWSSGHGVSRLVETVMTPLPVTISRWSSVDLALALAEDARVDHLLVMDSGRVVGVLCVCKLWEAQPDDLLATHMTPHVISIGSRMSIREAAWVMQRFEIGCLPVMANRCLAGVITRGDLARAGIHVLETGPVCASCGDHRHVRGDACFSCRHPLT
jgi:CBS domain-containing protein